MHPHLEPWHVRMTRARRWHLSQLGALTRRPPDADELRAVAASVVAHKLPGWKLAAEPTRESILADYRRVIRRNNLPTLACLRMKEAAIRCGVASDAAVGAWRAAA